MKIKSQMKICTPAALIAAWELIDPRDVDDDVGTISIMDVIDGDYGVSAVGVKSALRKADGADVKVLINSPGGDLVEAIAIYNLLSEYSGKVDIKILSIAASAASVIAMAGDSIEVMTGAHIMVHNTWSIVVGNRHDMLQAAEMLEGFDTEMVGIYAKRSGLSVAEVMELVDKSSYLNGEAAVSYGFADSVSASTIKRAPSAKLSALRAVEAALQASGISRADRRDLIKELTGGTPSADPQPDKPSAVEIEALDNTATIAASLKTIFKGVI